MRRTCRLWWPKQLSVGKPSPSSILFGWFISNSLASLDVVVALACDEQSGFQLHSGLEVILHEINKKMPTYLQGRSIFSVLGQCLDLSNQGQFSSAMDGDKRHSSSHNDICVGASANILKENIGRWTCGCFNLDGFPEQCMQASTGNSNQLLLIYNLEPHSRIENHWIPKLHHMHWNGQKVSNCDVHVIIYDSPVYGYHHFTLHITNPSEQAISSLKKPKWIGELHKKKLLFNLDTVIFAINCTAAAKTFFEGQVGPGRSYLRPSIARMFLSFTWILLAMLLASLSTILCTILQLLHRILRCCSQLWIHSLFTELFWNACINIRIRGCQILYWPIILQERGHRLPSNIEYAEKVASYKHSLWSSLAVDIMLGNVIGLVVLYHAESSCSLVLNFANVITNQILRSGCVWLMGIPAGFKLNTELAGVLGIVSLNAIQIWSTLWTFVGFIFIYVIKVLAMLGIILGATVPGALIMDLIRVATLHVSLLHWLISFLYSSQIEALAALWRLFRGQKWNPLRERLDSYDYTVKQHVVGSLLFALLLLLLPTTSVFYIFFTIMNININLICMVIEIMISLIHTAPYVKIFRWLVRRSRFPFGVWFEIVSCSNVIDSCDDVDFANESDSAPMKCRQEKDTNRESSSVLVSFLHSNFYSIGQLLLPYLRDVFSGVSTSFMATAVRGVLTGKRIPSTLGTGLPSPLPWMSIPFKQYWCMCFDAIIECKPSS